MKLEGILSEKYINLNVEFGSKSEVIDAMLAMVAGHDNVQDHERLSEDVWKREKEMSTGIGKSIALPHAKTTAVSAPVLAMITLKREIDFDSIDSEPVQIIFLLATPEPMLAEHLKLLGRITRLAGREDVRQRIIDASNPRELLELFRAEEKDLPQI